MDVKNKVKALLYTIKQYSLPQNNFLNLCFVFHTEQLYSEKTFEILYDFCQKYYKITNTQVINTVMPFNNPRINYLSKINNCSEATYIERINKLSSVSSIGYHGHFYDGDNIEKELKHQKRNLKYIEEQFKKELYWFKNNIATFQPLYSSGWWYINEDILSLLHKHKIEYDFSFTYNLNFVNEFSKKYLKEKLILFGEKFKTNSTEHIQTLIGCHNTPFFQDFTRNLNKLLRQTNNKSIIGAVCTHDYNLVAFNENTMNCIVNLMKEENVSFFDWSDLNNNLVD